MYLFISENEREREREREGGMGGGVTGLNSTLQDLHDFFTINVLFGCFSLRGFPFYSRFFNYMDGDVTFAGVIDVHSQGHFEDL